MPPKKRIDKQKILDASIHIADEQGLEALSLAKVAEALGIRIPSLYNHISSLDGLRYELSIWGLQELRAKIIDSAIGKAGDAAILSMANAYRAFAHQHSGIYHLTLRAAREDETELQQCSADLLAILVAIFAPYGLSEADNIHLIRAFRSLIHGFVDLELSGGFAMEYSCDESFQELIVLFLNGLNARSKG